MVGLGTHIKSDIEDIEKVQKRATKLVISLKKLPYKDRLEHLHLVTLKYRRLRGDMIEVYKIVTNKYESTVLPVLSSTPIQSPEATNIHCLISVFITMFANIPSLQE